MADEARFWNRLAERYARQPVADEASYRRKLDETRALLGPDMDVFEFGCGTGSTAIALAPHVRRITALDISENMLAIARDKARSAGVTNIDFIEGDMMSRPAPIGRYDAVLGMSILHLVNDPPAAIARVNALLRPGGRFFSSTACVGDSMPWLGALVPAGRALGLLPNVRMLRKADLLDTIRNAGFTIETAWQPARDKAVFVIARKAPMSAQGAVDGFPNTGSDAMDRRQPDSLR